MSANFGNMLSKNNKGDISVPACNRLGSLAIGLELMGPVGRDAPAGADENMPNHIK